MTDRENLDLARQWAADIDADQQTLSQDTIDAAADLISSLPDEWVDTNDLREVIDRLRREGGHVSEALADELTDILPTPKPRTLADMTGEERQACQWMQADHVEHGRIIITYVSDEYVHYLKLGGRSGVTTPTWEELITPLPDLPRMEWPTDEPAEDTPEPERTRPEDVPVGEPWQVEVDGRAAIGYRSDPAERHPWAVVCRDRASLEWRYDREVTLIARLVPETTEREDGPVFDPAYVYRDRTGDRWAYVAGGWRWGGHIVFRPRHTPPAEYGPYTRIEEI